MGNILVFKMRENDHGNAPNAQQEVAVYWHVHQKNQDDLYYVTAAVEFSNHQPIKIHLHYDKHHLQQDAILVVDNETKNGLFGVSFYLTKPTETNGSVFLRATGVLVLSVRTNGQSAFADCRALELWRGQAETSHKVFSRSELA